MTILWSISRCSSTVLRLALLTCRHHRRYTLKSWLCRQQTLQPEAHDTTRALQESPPLAQKLKTGSFGSTGELSAALEQLDGSHFFWLCTSVTIMQRFSDFCRGRA